MIEIGFGFVLPVKKGWCVEDTYLVNHAQIFRCFVYLGLSTENPRIRLSLKPIMGGICDAVSPAATTTASPV